MGTIVRDALAASLYTTQSVATDNDGTSVDVKYPLGVAAAEVTVTTDITGTGQATIAIEGSQDDSNWVQTGASRSVEEPLEVRVLAGWLHQLPAEAR